MSVDGMGVGLGVSVFGMESASDVGEEGKSSGGKRRMVTGVGVPVMGSLGGEKVENLRRAAAWMEEERVAGRKVSVRTTADKFQLPKTTLHRFMNKLQGGEGGNGEKGDLKGEDGKKRDKLEISFLLQDEQKGGFGGAASEMEMETEVLLSSSSASTDDGAKSSKRTKTEENDADVIVADETQEQEETTVETQSKEEQKARMRKIDREILKMRITLANLHERVKVLEEQHRNTAAQHSAQSQLTSTG